MVFTTKSNIFGNVYIIPSQDFSPLLIEVAYKNEISTHLYSNNVYSLCHVQNKLFVEPLFVSYKMYMTYYQRNQQKSTKYIQILFTK
jgi:hypothetical protein